MRIVDKVKARMELERYNAKLEEVRAAMGDRRKSFTDIVREHINIAMELQDEAIAAIKYNPSQTLHVLKTAWVHLDVAYTVVKSAQLAKLPGLPNEAEEKIGYLSSTLARVKAMIEYSNCWVSDFARELLDGALAFYQTALTSLEKEDPEQAIRAAQAGLLKVSLASEVIRSENQRSLPGWTGLSNPMLASPLRRTHELTKAIAQTRVLLNSLHDPEAAAQFAKVMRKHHRAMESLVNNDIDHAQAIITKLLVTVEDIRNAATDQIGELDEPLDKTDLAVMLDSAAGVDLVLAELQELFKISDFDNHRELAGKRPELVAVLESIAYLYADAMKSAQERDLQGSELSVATAIFNLDLLRQRLFPNTQF